MISFLLLKKIMIFSNPASECVKLLQLGFG